MDRKSTGALAANGNTPRRMLAALRARFTLAPNDLLRDVVYRRLWASVLTRMDPLVLTRVDPRSARPRVTAEVHPRSP